MSQFTTTQLVAGQVLVQGEDQFGVSGRTVLDGTQWEHINSHKEFDQAEQAFDDAVKAFFAPLTEAADELKKAIDKPEDSLGYVVLKEAVEGEKPQAEELVKLTKDSMVLRLLEQGDHDRLVWVDEQLEILAVIPTTNTAATSGTNGPAGASGAAASEPAAATD